MHPVDPDPEDSPEALKEASPPSAPRMPDLAWIRRLAERFSHDARPEESAPLGCQRDSYDDLGFGWLYFGLPRATSMRDALVIGSGRGFSPACLALGLSFGPEGRVVLVDPGYEGWSVEAAGDDRAVGLWSRLANPAEYFSEHLALDNVEVLKARSDEAFRSLAQEERRFDLILVDGDHGFEQCLTDLRNALALLRPEGLLLVHDVAASQWLGPVLAVETLALERPDLDRLVLSAYPGLAVLQRRQSPIRMLPASEADNRRINRWRRESGVTERPLPGGSDPRVGELRLEAREGLFGIHFDGRLVGGFGIYRRRFSIAGADDFEPNEGGKLEGFLRYGAVIDREYRGRGLWRLAVCQMMSWFADEGIYLLSAHSRPPYSRLPLEVREVGRTPHHVAYHCAASPPEWIEGRLAVHGAVRSRGHEDLVSRLRRVESEAARREGLFVDLEGRHQSLKDGYEALKAESGALQASRSWRLTRPLRRFAEWLRRS